MTTVHILLGGPIDHLPENWATDGKEKTWIGVDRGALRLIDKGIVPQLALGDFDSVSEEEFSKIFRTAKNVKRVQAEKDDTDTELAIKEAFEMFEADQVVLFGGTGGRLDHLFSVLLIPTQPRFSPYVKNLRIEDRQNTVTFYLPGKYVLQKEADKDYVSFVSVAPLRSLTLKGLKYPLENHDTSHPVAYVSNEFLSDTAYFSFDEGLLAVVQSKD